MSNSISLFLTRPRGQAMEMANDWFASSLFKTKRISFHKEMSEKHAKSPGLKDGLRLFYGDKNLFFGYSNRFWSHSELLFGMDFNIF